MTEYSNNLLLRILLMTKCPITLNVSTDLNTYYKTVTHRQTSGSLELLSNPLDASLELLCGDLRSLRFHLDIVRQSAGGLPGTQASSASLLFFTLLSFTIKGAELLPQTQSESPAAKQSPLLTLV